MEVYAVFHVVFGIEIPHFVGAAVVLPLYLKEKGV